MNKIAVKSIGSCATRDMKPICRKIDLVGNVGFTSIFTILGKPIPFQATKELIANKAHPPSDYELKMMNLDLSKGAFDYIKGNPCQYVILDLIDERYDFLKYADDSYTLLTDPFEKVHHSALRAERVRHQDLSREIIDEKIKRFCDEILKIYEGKKVMINRALMVHEYIDQDGNIREFEQISPPPVEFICKLTNLMIIVLIITIRYMNISRRAK